jgi:hypothetical protein
VVVVQVEFEAVIVWAVPLDKSFDFVEFGQVDLAVASLAALVLVE